MPLVGVNDPVTFELAKRGVPQTAENYQRMSEALNIGGYKQGSHAPVTTDMSKRARAHFQPASNAQEEASVTNDEVYGPTQPSAGEQITQDEHGETNISKLGPNETTNMSNMSIDDAYLDSMSDVRNIGMPPIPPAPPPYQPDGVGIGEAALVGTTLATGVAAATHKPQNANANANANEGAVPYEQANQQTQQRQLEAPKTYVDAEGRASNIDPNSPQAADVRSQVAGERYTDQQTEAAYKSNELVDRIEETYKVNRPQAVRHAQAALRDNQLDNATQTRLQRIVSRASKTKDAASKVTNARRAARALR